MQIFPRLSNGLVALGLALTLILTALPVSGVSATPILSAAVAVPPGGQAMSSEICFKESGLCTENAFLDFWSTNGAVEILGYPIDEARRHPDGLIRQFYERAILEWHPENKVQYQVLLTRLGAGLIDGKPQTTATPVPCAQHCILFRETNHTLRGAFSDYWNRYGGLPVFGLPLTEEFIEISPTNGQPYVVQYFERNRFEYHPENSGRYQVLLGLLGGETLNRLGNDVRALPIVMVPSYGANATAPQIAALPLEGAVGSTFVFIFVGLHPDTDYAILLATDSARTERIREGVFRTNSEGVLSLQLDSSGIPPGGYLIGAFDDDGKLVVSASFAIFFMPGG